MRFDGGLDESSLWSFDRQSGTGDHEVTGDFQCLSDEQAPGHDDDLCECSWCDPNRPKLGQALRDPDTRNILRPWQQRRLQTLGVAEAYGDIIDEWERVPARAPHAAVVDELRRVKARMLDCGSFLHFVTGYRPASDQELKRLTHANFCKSRLCPMCNWRRARKLAVQLEAVVAEYQRRNPDTALLLLTLTGGRTVEAEGLGERVDRLQEAFKSLRNRKFWPRKVIAWFRALEVTVSEGRYHPHFHVLLIVPREVADKSSKEYLHKTEWQAFWKDCLGLEYDPIVWIEHVRKIKELTKYVTKPSDYLKWRGCDVGFEADAAAIKALHFGLRRRRMSVWSGEMSKLRGELGFKDIERDDVDLVENEGFSEDVVPIRREKYTWCRGKSRKLGSYRLAHFSPVNEGDEDPDAPPDDLWQDSDEDALEWPVTCRRRSADQVEDGSWISGAKTAER
jgi:plasmid rolling circle replication initiator protein Rep